MRIVRKYEELRPELHETAQIIVSSYPESIPAVAYKPLLRLLYAGMSFRTVARIVSWYLGTEYIRVYHDVLGAVSEITPDQPRPEDIEEVRRTLRQHGYDRWLAKME